MLGFGGRSRWLLIAVWLLAGCAGLFHSAPLLPRYLLSRTLELGKEWRFEPLVVDLNGDGHLDLVATARLAEPSLHMWLGDGKGGFSPVEPTWSDIGYAALATGDINRDGSPDIVAASHFGGVQTLLSDGRGGFTEKIVRREDGYVEAQLADLNGDGHLDLILLGFKTAGLEVYFGDGTGNWTLQTSLPETRPRGTLAGRSLIVEDLNHDGHPDVVGLFQRWGMYIYYGNEWGGLSGGRLESYSPTGPFESVALGDVNKDSHPDLVINGALGAEAQRSGPDVYLGDGRGGWTNSSAGLKVLRFAAAGLALGHLDGDGNLDIVAAGNVTGGVENAHGLLWFRGDGKGGWRLVRESGLPSSGLSVVHSITLADVDQDGLLEIIALSGGTNGSITIWKRR